MGELREQIAKMMYERGMLWQRIPYVPCNDDDIGLAWGELQEDERGYYLDDADAILAIPAIAIVDREAELPKNPYPESVFPGMSITELQQVAEACKAAGIPLGRLSGSWGRQVWDNCLREIREQGWVEEAPE